MGLDIRSQSDKDYSYNYSGIHYIRYMAYCSIGGQDSYLDWHHNYYGAFGNTEPFEITGKYEEAQEKFINLYNHSDCDGTYTMRGKVEPLGSTGGLQTGNSKALLKELQFVKDNLQETHDGHDKRNWYVFDMFYDLVEDVVNNHNGRIEFS